MAYPNRLMYTALLLIEAAANGDYNDYREVDVLLTRSDVEPEHVAWQLATMLAPVIRQRPGWKKLLEEQISAARLIADADTGTDKGMFANE